MHESQVQIHYAPASVGALIDTALLRRAIRDAEGGHAGGERVPVSRRPWRLAIRALITLCLRHGQSRRTDVPAGEGAIAGVEKSGD